MTLCSIILQSQKWTLDFLFFLIKAWLSIHSDMSMCQSFGNSAFICYKGGATEKKKQICAIIFKKSALYSIIFALNLIIFACSPLVEGTDWFSQSEVWLNTSMSNVNNWSRFRSNINNWSRLDSRQPGLAVCPPFSQENHVLCTYCASFLWICRNMKIFTAKKNVNYPVGYIFYRI